jgi:hypothetical protein
MNLPLQIRIGDTVKWSEPAVGDYSAPTYTRTVSLRQATGSITIDVVGVANGSGWDFTLTAAQSATLAAGDVYAQDYVTLGGERYTLADGTIKALGNLAAAAGAFDGRLQSEKDLAAVQAAIRAKIAGGDVQEYSIGGRSLKKIPVADLIALENKLKADVASEKRAARVAAGLPSGRNLFVRF